MSDVTETRMTASEYSQLPETNTPQELIDGELIMSPPPNPVHQEIVGNIYLLLVEAKKKAGGKVYLAPVGVKLDETNILEPDVVYLKPDSQCTVAKQYLEGAPDLVAEVLSPSTARRDKREKFDLYEKHGVTEYWMVEPDAEYVEVWLRDNAKFKKLGIYAPEDRFQSTVLNQAIECKKIFDS